MKSRSEKNNSTPPLFDEYATTYEEELQNSLGVMAPATGEGFFNKHKVNCIQRFLPDDKYSSILDFGCGNGGVMRELAIEYPRANIVGFDISTKISALAIQKLAQFDNVERVVDLESVGNFDLVIVSNVMHHVPIFNRTQVLRKVARCLSTNGHLVVFEHNPLNPFTRKVVRDCQFDKDAELLNPKQLLKYTTDIGLENINLRYVLYLPWAGVMNNILEKIMGHFPFGAQYMAVFKRGPIREGCNHA